MEWLIRILNANKSEKEQLIEDFLCHLNSENTESQYSKFEYEYLWDVFCDLDDYEPNPEWRYESASFYGDEKLEQILKKAIFELEKYKKENE